MNTADAPILLLASGQRTGSTLLQRWFLSHPRMMIWGEHDGVFETIFQRYERLYAWETMFAHHLESFQQDGYNNFVPNMIPPRATLEQGLRAMIETLYRYPTAEMGRYYWGFKEVLYDAEMAVRLRSLYPNLKVVFITRHPFPCLVSLLHEERLKPSEINIPLSDIWTRQKTTEWVQNWARINRSFLDHPQVDSTWFFRLTYEELVAHPDETTRQLAAWLGMDATQFDLDVFAHRLYTDRDNQQASRADRRQAITWNDLTAEEYRLITQTDVREVASRLGYSLNS